MAVFLTYVACVVAWSPLILLLSTPAASVAGEVAGLVLQPKKELDLANGAAQNHAPVVFVLTLNVYCTVLHCTALYCTVPYRTVMCCALCVHEALASRGLKQASPSLENRVFWGCCLIFLSVRGIHGQLPLRMRVVLEGSCCDQSPASLLMCYNTLSDLVVSGAVVFGINKCTPVTIGVLYVLCGLSRSVSRTQIGSQASNSSCTLIIAICVVLQNLKPASWMMHYNRYCSSTPFYNVYGVCKTSL